MTIKSLLALSVLLVFNLYTPHLTDGATVDRASDGMCRLYDYITGFSLTVNGNSYVLDDAFCQGLPQPHAGQPTQCLPVARTVYRNTENWNQCPPGFYLQGNDQMQMICCKPSSHSYTWYDCSDVPVQANSYEVNCPAGFIVTRTKDRHCGSSICLSAISCCAIPDEPGPVKNLDDVKGRVMDDTQVPLSLLAHFLGFAWCGGCDGRYVGESMKKSGDKWISSTSGSCPGPRKNERLSITYSDFKLMQSNIALSETTYSELKPVLLSTDYFVNNDTEAKTVTVGQEIYREHTITHTKLTSFTMSHDTEFQVSYKSTFLGGVETSSSYSFGYETTEEKTTGTENSEGSTISYTSEVTLPPCTAVDYKILLATVKATQYYNATIDVSYSAILESFLRSGGGRNGRYTNFHSKYRGSGTTTSFSYKFGSPQKSLHDDLKEQSRNNRGPWEWKNMEDRYQYAGTLLDILTDRSRHEFDLKGRFDELIGYKAYILFQKTTPPAGCKIPERNERSVPSTDPQGTTQPPVMDFQETLVRYVDLSTGSYSDIADVDPNEITGSGDSPEKNKVKEEILYFLPNGDRNPNFNFAKYFVALGNDKLLVVESETGPSAPNSSSSTVECHHFLIIFCIAVMHCGKRLYKS